MSYKAPELGILASAIKAVKSTVQDKGLMSLLDSRTHVLNATPNAYEADE